MQMSLNLGEVFDMTVELRCMERRLRAVRRHLRRKAEWACGAPCAVRTSSAGANGWLSVAETAGLLLLSESRVRGMIREGRLAARRTRNGRLWVRVSAAERAYRLRRRGPSR